MSAAELLPAILSRYQTELDESRQVLEQNPHNDLLNEFVRQMTIAVADWSAIINGAPGTMALARRRRSAWERRNASQGDMTELGMRIHALACNELAALGAVDPKPT